MSKLGKWIVPQRIFDVILAERERGADAARDDYLEKHHQHMDALIDWCESPIEIILGAHLFNISDGYNSAEFINPGMSGEPNFGTIWSVQVPVGPYRADFLFKPCFEGKHRILVVECDGHDFHERTKEQASRDKERDRWMTKNGVRLLRFTGSDLYSRPIECVDDIGSVLTDLMDEMLVAAGKIEPRLRSALA